MRNTILFCLMLLWSTVQAQVSGTAGISSAQLTIEATETGGFHRITGGNEYITTPGYPELPVITQSYVLPFDAVVTGLTTATDNRVRIPGNYRVFPAQHPIPVSDTPPPPFAEAVDSIYTKELYPGVAAEIIEDGYDLGYHVVTVRIYPVEYRPLSSEIYTRSVTFTINYTMGGAPADVARPATQTYRRAALCRETIREKVENKGDVEMVSTGVQQVEPENIELSLDTLPVDKARSAQVPISVFDRITPDYLIITNNELKPEFEVLARWKTQKGIPTKIKVTEEIALEYPGVDLPEKIRNYLKKVEKKWGANLYVLLGGDVNIIPARMIQYDFYSIIASDMYFASTGGTWKKNGNTFAVPNNASEANRIWMLGRISVKNRTEAKRFIEKLFYYEMAEEIRDKSYFKNHAALVAALSKNNSSGIFTCNYLAPVKVNGYDKNNITNPWLVTDDFNCDNPLFSYGPIENLDKFEPPCVGSPYTKQELNKENAMMVLNDSIPGIGHTHILYHLDHSNVYMMGASSKHKGHSIAMGDLDALTNRDYPQIIFSGGCKPATFNEECIGEKYLNNPGSGGIAYIGNSYNGYYQEHPQFVEFLNTLYAQSKGIVGQYAIGRAFNEGVDAIGDPSRLHLLGEPEMPVWTDTPKSLRVVVNTTSKVGRTVSVSVSVSGLTEGVPATICFQKDNEHYGTRVITTNGTCSFGIQPRTSGTATVTVTAHNYYPVVKEVSVGAKGFKFGLGKIELTDDGTFDTTGDGNGIADSGETVALTVWLRRLSSLGSDNVTATLRSKSPFIELKDSIVHYIAKSSEDSVFSEEKFRFSISKDAPVIWGDQLNGDGLFELILDNGDYRVTDYFSININAPEIRLRDRLDIRNGSGSSVLKAGDVVRFRMKLFNGGTSKAVGLKVKLASPYTYVLCQQAAVSLGNIEAKSEGINETLFEITLGNSYVIGGKIPITATVTDNYGHSWKLTFDLTDPKPVRISNSNITFRANESNVTLSWTGSGSIRGYNVYREFLENGVSEYRKLNTFELEMSVFTDHFLDAFTQYNYKISIVSDKGLEGELSEVIKTSTTYPLRSGFPVVFSDNAYFMRASMNAADVNNDGIKELMTTLCKNDYTTSGFLVGLTKEGYDLFDYDSNVTTHGGVALQNASLQSHPGIGDIDGDGRPEVVTISRWQQTADQDSLNYLTCYSMFDQDGDRLPDLIWQRRTKMSSDKAPVLSDLDGDEKLEIIVRGDDTSLVGIYIYNYRGERLLTLDAGGKGGAVAVADLDGDGDMEIVAGTKTGVCIWHHDGTPFSTNPMFTQPGCNFLSSVTVCDLNGDGDKEILIAATSNAIDTNRKETDSPVFAFNLNGQLLPGWNGSQKTRFDIEYHQMHQLSVCDMDRDGRVEVVCVGIDSLKIWNSDGSKRTAVKMTVPGIKISAQTPILADVDGDGEAEVVMALDKGSNNIFAYKLSGEMAKGFPLQAETYSVGAPCVTDLDGDGLNELIVCNFNMVHVWNTLGISSPDEWGYANFNQYNTGEYLVCHPVEINASCYWDSSRQVCGDIVISSGALMVRNGLLTVGADASITVRSGAELIVDGWSEVRNADIRVESGGTLTLINGGQIHLRPGGRVYLEKGATLNNLDGALYPR